MDKDGIEGADLGCGMKRVGVQVKTKPLHCTGPLLVIYYIINHISYIISWLTTIDTSLLKASVIILYFNIVSFISFITNSLNHKLTTVKVYSR